jgi:hypothetical protein
MARHTAAAAKRFAFLRDGMITLSNRAMIAITTSSSIRVNAGLFFMMTPFCLSEQ